MLFFSIDPLIVLLYIRFYLCPGQLHPFLHYLIICHQRKAIKGKALFIMKGAAKKLQWFGRQLWIRRTWIGLLFLRGTAAEGNKQHNDEKKNELLFYLHNLKPPLFLKNNFITSLVTLLSFWVYLNLLLNFQINPLKDI